MKQIEATPARPFYSVCYQYEQVPGTLYSYNHWEGHFGRTMQGTDSFEEAKQHAQALVSKPGIVLAYVHKSTDCYNHQEVFKAERKAEGRGK